MDTPDYYSGPITSTVSDERIRRDLWSGGLAIEFCLADADVNSEKSAPRPFYLHASRVSYLPLIGAAAVQHFLDHAEKEDVTDVWLEHENKPLQWHYPVGALFDHSSSQHQLPWRVVVHLSDFPTNGVLRWPGSEEALQSTFFHALKEAQYLKFFSTKSVMSLSKADQMQLWDGIRDFNYDLFWQVNHQLASYTTEQRVRHIPVRVLTGEPPVIQPSVPPYNEDGSPRRLGDVMHKLFPHIFQELPVTDDTTDSVELAKRQTAYQEGYPRVYVQGVLPPLETPLTWLSEIMMNPDNFLYLCVQTGPRT